MPIGIRKECICEDIGLCQLLIVDRDSDNLISPVKMKICFIGYLTTMLKGPAAFNYLKNAFANHFGSPSDALTSLPLTAQWISSIWHGKDQEWNEHKNSLLALTSDENPYQGHLPSAALRTAGSLMVKTNGNIVTSVPSAATNTGLICETHIKVLYIKNHSNSSIFEAPKEEPLSP